MTNVNIFAVCVHEKTNISHLSTKNTPSIKRKALTLPFSKTLI